MSTVAGEMLGTKTAMGIAKKQSAKGMILSTPCSCDNHKNYESPMMKSSDAQTYIRIYRRMPNGAETEQVRRRLLETARWICNAGPPLR